MSQELAWNGVHARTSAASVDSPSRDGGYATSRGLSSHLVVERAGADRLAAITDDWRDLGSRADSRNIFMHPLLLAAAMASYPERNIVPLLAWEGARLVGFWAFAQGHPPRSVVPVQMLSAPPTPNAYLAQPVIDRDRLEPVLDAFLTHVAGATDLPKIVALDAVNVDGATSAALTRVIAARRGAVHVFSHAPRPMLASELDAKAYFEQAMSASSRKKLRQHRRRLGEKGALQSIVITEPKAVCRAFEDFLALEAAGWKGREGTALLSDAADAAFARAMVCTLAEQGEAAIHALALDGKPASMQIVLRSGRTAYTWKTAFDEALHDFSPGTLLFEDYTASLIADPEIDVVDSCSFDDSGYMASWRERATLAHLWFDARPGGSATFTLAVRLQSAYLAVRAQAKAVYLRRMRRKRR